MDKRQDDIERYLKGELTPAEMHALEKRALSDPFLADALEGASSLDPEAFAQDVASLRYPNKSRKIEAPGIWSWTLRIAAGVAFLIVAAMVIYNLRSQVGREQITENRPVPKASEREPAATDSVSSVEEPEAKAQPPTAAPPPNPERSVARRPSVQKEEARTEIAESPEYSESDQRDADDQAAIAMETPQEEEIVPEPIQSAPAARQENTAGFAKPVPQRVVSGVVIDSEDGKGLPGVNVTIRGTNIGTVTDEEGRYKIPMDSLNNGLLFSFIGFESREVVPDNTMRLDVMMSPDIAQLSEVVVVGYGADKEEEEKPPVVEMAAPAGGRKAYKQYLEQGMRYPQQALNNKVEGKVTIQFTIESNGKMGEFQVLKGIGYGCDEEVIRLIKEGPAWVPTRKDKQPVRDKVKVRLRFALPKKQ